RAWVDQRLRFVPQDRFASGQETDPGHDGRGGDPAAPPPARGASARTRVGAPVARPAAQPTLEGRGVLLACRALVNQPHGAFTETAFHRCPLSLSISPSAPRRYVTARNRCRLTLPSLRSTVPAASRVDMPSM